MGKISEIFNFDNIGGKIKNLAKWSCWITILLIWIAAPIAFIALVADDWTAEFCWIPLVGAIVGPVLVWVESWLLYAFGELVEKTADNENNTRQILKKINENPANYITEESEGKVKSIIASEPTISKASKTSNEEKENWTDTTNFSTTEKGTIICSQCNFEQPGNRSCCWNCGAKFENE